MNSRRELVIRRVRIGLVAMSAFLTSVVVASAECTIRGSDAIAHAISIGFEFKSTVVGGRGGCSLSKTHFIVSASDTEDVSCELVFFGGRSLKTGWSIQSVEYDGGIMSQPNQPVSPGIAVVVTAIKGTTRVFSIKQITLKGGDCRLWRDAF